MSPPKDVIEQTALMIAQDNMEVACCFIQKTAIEKALLDIDKRMSVVSWLFMFTLRGCNRHLYVNIFFFIFRNLNIENMRVKRVVAIAIRSR